MKFTLILTVNVVDWVDDSTSQILRLNNDVTEVLENIGCWTKRREIIGDELCNLKKGKNGQMLVWSVQIS